MKNTMITRRNARADHWEMVLRLLAVPFALFIVTLVFAALTASWFHWPVVGGLSK
jgi:hypothetical protein